MLLSAVRRLILDVVALMDLGFSTHAFHSSSHLVFLTANLSAERTSLTVQTPPNNRVYPPGPGTALSTAIFRAIPNRFGSQDICS
jgi:hypothetical protein